MSYIQIRIDKKDKDEARKVLDKLGLDMSSGIKLFLRQVVIKQGLPFAVDRDLDHSRETTGALKKDGKNKQASNKTEINLNDFKKSRAYLFWDVHLDSLDKEAVVERILNYGDWEDVQLMFRIVGLQETAKIFRKQISRPRNNYDVKIKNYYNLYFNKHAQRSPL